MSATTVIIPTYNEAQNIARMIARVRASAPDVRVLVVDDNSPDGTADVVRGLMKIDQRLSLFSRQQKEGLGKAYLAAFDEVLKDPSVEWIQMMDADFSHDPKYLPEMFAAAKHVDVVIGSRYVSGGGTVGWVLWKRLLSRFANRYCRIITGMPTNDCTSGFILMRTSVMRTACLQDIAARGHAFMMELKYRLWKYGARIAEVPVVLEDRLHGASKMSRGVIGEAALAPWRMRFKKRYTGTVMKTTEQKVPSTCPLCNASNPAFFMHKNNCTMYECRECRLWFVYPIPPVGEVYTEDYFLGSRGGFGYVDYERDKQPMISTSERYLQKIGKYLSGRGKLLDIGAATGFFLAIAQRFGFECYGVEISAYAAERAREKGFPVITGTPADVPREPLFDVVTMIDVIEHVTDPRTELMHAHALLREGGIFAIDTQDAGSVWARLMRKRWHLIVPPEHLYYFSRKNISLLLEQCGFEVLEISTVGKRFTPPYIFSMLYKWQKLSLWRSLMHVSERGWLSRLYIPINLRDTMFVVARKRS